MVPSSQPWRPTLLAPHDLSASSTAGKEETPTGMHWWIPGCRWNVPRIVLRVATRAHHKPTEERLFGVLHTFIFTHGAFLQHMGGW